MEEIHTSSEGNHTPSLFAQTTEAAAKAAVEAAAAIRPRPSIVVSAQNSFSRNPNFQKWKGQFQKVLTKWGLNPKESGRKSVFNPEILANQKRQWIDLQLKNLEKKTNKEPTCIFEHFVVVGLHPETNVDAVEAAFAKKKAWERDYERAEKFIDDFTSDDYGCRAPPAPTLEPQVLFKYPPGKRLPLRSKDLTSFCFPNGVEARIVERTPSMSDLNEVIYGQDHQTRDDLAFGFLLKVADNATLYGICICVREIVQRPPAFLAANTAISSFRLSRSRFLVSAPRCYCILTKLPFFKLHFEVLQSIIAQERLDRINQCVSEMTLSESVPPLVKVRSRQNGKPNSPDVDSTDEWMDSAIPVEDVLGAAAAAAGLISESKLPSFSSKHSSMSRREMEVNDTLEESSPAKHNGSVVEAANDVHTSNGSPEDGKHDRTYPANGCVGVDDGLCNVSSNTDTLQPGTVRHERIESSESIYSIVESSAQSADSDDDDLAEASSSGQEDDYGRDAVLAWAEANDNDSLRIICSYHRVPIPERGTCLNFQALDHIQPITFYRPGIIQLTLLGKTLDPSSCRSNLELAEFRAAALAEEEALLLSIWTTATVCRSLSLQSVMTMLAGVLLEKQVVVICSNPGILSAVVLSLKPMLRPFEWQSLLLPILPNKMLDFLDAPVPFIVGVQHKTSEVRVKTSNLMRVNVYKDQVKMASLPQLPRHRELALALEPYYSKLAAEKESASRHPVHEYSESQAKATEGFLAVLRSYLESLCMDVRSHTITNVQANNDRVSLLLKESFIDSFASRDRPFIKLFADTQLFSVHTDAVLSNFQTD